MTTRAWVREKDTGALIWLYLATGAWRREPDKELRGRTRYFHRCVSEELKRREANGGD